MAQQSSDRFMHAMRQHTNRWLIVLVVPLVVLVAACSGGKTTAQATTPVASSGGSATPVAATTATPGQTLPQITPIPGNYSVYVDPTYGYSFEYPSQWIPNPATGTAPGPYYYQGSVKESNVDIADPIIPNEQHAAMQLTVRVTNDYNAQFVQHFYCNPDPTESPKTIDGYAGEDLTQRGGTVTYGLEAPAFGFIFPIKAKGLVVEVWLQTSARVAEDINYFIQTQQATFQHAIDTFNPGPGAQQIGSC